MRKVFAIIFTIATFFAIKETIFIFTSSDADIIAKHTQLKLASLSIAIPLVIISFLLWRPKQKGEKNES